MPDRGARRGLELVSIGGVGDGLLELLGEELDRRFGTRSFRGPALPLMDAWRDPGTGQYRSRALVDALVARAEALGAEPERLWSLGIADADLCAPGRTFVFGEATVGGCCAVVGTARLDPGEGPRSPRLRARVLAEAVHELGHVAGLGHCHRAACVMHPCETVEEADRRGTDFCRRCAEALRRPG